MVEQRKISRRSALQVICLGSAAALGAGCVPASAPQGAAGQPSIEKHQDAVYPVRRVRPGDPSWPSEASWDSLNQEVSGRLIKVESPLAVCQAAPNSAPCSEVLKQLKDPFFIGDEPALTQTSGWIDAWTSVSSVYAVAATKTDDVVAAVNFARENNLRLVVKGGGHSYQGTSNSADSLLIWTRPMNSIVLHDAFVAQGCVGKQAPQPAVSVGAGAIWM